MITLVDFASSGVMRAMPGSVATDPDGVPQTGKRDGPRPVEVID
jgi:hypothetical protein